MNKLTPLYTGIAFALCLPAHAAQKPLLIQESEEYEDSGFDDEFADFYGDEEFISIATGSKKSISRAPSVATVISSEEIKRLGVNTVHQAIETVTGIHVYPSNFNRLNPSYSIRGIHTRQNPQVLVLVNGVRTTHLFSGAKWNMFNVGVDIIDRVEVIRGPGSAVHGADAYSGVINIVTKGYDNSFDNDVGVRAGSFNTKSSWFNWGTEKNGISYSVNAQWSDTDGDDSRIIEQDALGALGLGFISNAPGPLDTRLTTTDFHANIRSEHLYGEFWYLKNAGGTGAGAAQVLSNNDSDREAQFTANLGYKFELTDVLKLDLSASYQRHQIDTFFTIFPPGMILPRSFDPATGAPTAFTVFTDGIIGNPAGDERSLIFKAVTEYTGLQDHHIRGEVGFQRMNISTTENKNFGIGVQNGTEDFIDGNLTNVTGTPFVFLPRADRNLRYISVQDEWAFDKDWELTAGLRYDDYSDFGSTLNPRLALVWQTKHNLTTKFLYGRAFRAPSFDELNAVNNPVILGNPELDPETIDTLEFAVDYRPNFDWKILFNVFMFEAQDLIIYVPRADGSAQADNASDIDGKGMELEIHWQATDDLKYKLGYSWQDAEEQNVNQDVADAPQQAIDMVISWKLNEDLALNIDSRWILDRDRLNSDPRNAIDNYNWTNLNLEYQLSSNINLGLSVRNVFDEEAFEPSDGQIPGDYPLEERGYWLTATYQL